MNFFIFENGIHRSTTTPPESYNRAPHRCKSIPYTSQCFNDTWHSESIRSSSPDLSELDLRGQYPLRTGVLDSAVDFCEFRPEVVWGW